MQGTAATLTGLRKSINPKVAEIITTQLRSRGQRCTAVLFDTAHGDTPDQLTAKVARNKSILAVIETSTDTFVGYTAGGDDKHPLQEDPTAWIAWSGSPGQVFSAVAGEYTVICGGFRWGVVRCHLWLGDSTSINWQHAQTKPYSGPRGRSYAGCNFPKGRLVPTRVIVFEVTTTAGPCEFVKYRVNPQVIAQLQVHLRSHKAFTEDEEEQLATMAAQPIPALESTEFVVTDDTKPEALLKGMRTANTLIVKSRAALAKLGALQGNVEESQVVRIRLQFAATDSPAVIAALTQCGPFVHVLETLCPSVAHARCIVRVMRRCPPQHLKCVYLTGAKTLDADAMEVLTRLKGCTVLKLVFDENPTSIRISHLTALQRRNRRMELDSNTLLYTVLYPPDADLQIVPPASSALPADQLGFLTLSSLTEKERTRAELQVVPCGVNAAVKVSKLIRDMLQEPHGEQHAEPQPLEFRTNGESLDSLRVVQLLVAYIEYATRLVPDALDDTDQTVYRITLYDECFLKELEAGAAPREVLRLVLDLLGAATFLNMPSLKRLLRSYLIRSACDYDCFVAKHFGAAPALPVVGSSSTRKRPRDD